MNFSNCLFLFASIPALAAGLAGAVPGRQPHGVYRNFVQRRLSQKGLDVFGWN